MESQTIRVGPEVLPVRQNQSLPSTVKRSQEWKVYGAAQLNPVDHRQGMVFEFRDIQPNYLDKVTDWSTLGPPD